MINIIKDKNLFEDIGKYDLILIGTNVYGIMGNGFQREVAVYYPYVHEKNLRTKYGDVSKMGTVLECESDRDGEQTFLLMYITKGYNFKPDREKDYLSYESLEKCLKLTNILYKGKNIACPFLGCSKYDGNGDKDKVFEIIKNNVTNFDITIYDYYQKSRAEINKERWEKEQEIKKQDIELYYKVVRERKEQENKTKERNGRIKF